MIDTPGHVDFTYEVSRSLAACEGAVLLVDAAQGIEAQTLANLYLALENDLHDHPGAQQDRPAGRRSRTSTPAELAHIIGCDPDDVLRVSAKTGAGRRRSCSTRSCREVPAPGRRRRRPARAMIFDSVYDIYRGVVTYVRVIDGQFTPRERIKMMSTGATHELLEIGVISPEPKPTDGLGVGEVGYLITGVKDVRQSRVGDTVTDRPRKPAPRRRSAATATRSRWSTPASIPSTARTTRLLRDALDKLQLNDAALVYEPETSAALGFGFRCGFLGLLHLEIIRERLEREFDLDLISTAPNVVYRVVLEDGTELDRHQPVRLAGRQEDRRDLRAGRQGDDPRAERVHRRDHGAVPEPPRRSSAAWTTCPRPASSCATRCRSPRSSSTSSTS